MAGAGRTRVFAAGLAAGGVLGAGALAAAQYVSPQPVLPTRGGAASAATLGGVPASFAPIYERVAPAVVSIYSTATTPPTLLIPEFPFFGPPQLIPPMQAMSSGSGFFISADGYVLTNDHVVAGAEQVEVVLHDERRLPARLVGRDRVTDLAVLKVDGRGFTFVDFAAKDDARVGDWVITVGNPFGLGATATAGIVSAYGRDIGAPFASFLQLDAAINTGSSGGPAFDVQGRVVGVNTAILSPTGGFIGIGFAIPADVADRASQQIIQRSR